MPQSLLNSGFGGLIGVSLRRFDIEVPVIVNIPAAGAPLVLVLLGLATLLLLLALAWVCLGPVLATVDTSTLVAVCAVIVVVVDLKPRHDQQYLAIRATSKAISIQKTSVLDLTLSPAFTDGPLVIPERVEWEGGDLNGKAVLRRWYGSEDAEADERAEHEEHGKGMKEKRDRGVEGKLEARVGDDMLRILPVGGWAVRAKREGAAAATLAINCSSSRNPPFLLACRTCFTYDPKV
ncbi:hypothetical protein N7532_003065 [Penicillium argentinense]|uniref:Uncharacterized protein n=1 Tax=Penicillium argentinense TaxID=1131581 RepID=A0A9W9FLQ0_9EURO|nr:uncharacterized protein N7532_003065 [Penicillium argentinense]KAJ5102536.1 hypothetical protein N7532_003065 [Penicillium argentinense]